jgi:hypothetical protein
MSERPIQEMKDCWRKMKEFEKTKGNQRENPEERRGF